MATHEVFDSVSKTPLTRSTGNGGHNVTDQDRHLKSKVGAKSASIAQELAMLANPDHDVDSQFDSHPKNMRSHLPSREETK